MTQAGAQPALLFDLTLNDEQRITRETMQRFAETVIKPQTRQIDESSQMPVDLLQQAHDLGITLLAVPEEHGGAGSPRSPVSNVLIAEDLGKGDMGVALHILAPLGFVNLLIDQGSEAQKAKYLPFFAGESFAPVTVAISEPRATSDVHALQTKAVKDGAAFVLNGVKGMVPLASTAEHFAIIAEVEGEGPQAFLVEKTATGLTTEAQGYLGLHALGLGLVKL
ncbi:MAG: acyl-CoA dehydrogenase family protein, partial [Candidatus Macondimonas sp.]